MDKQRPSQSEKRKADRQIEDITGLSSGQLAQEVENSKPRLHGRLLTFMLAFVAGTGFTLFGYVNTDANAPAAYHCREDMTKELCLLSSPHVRCVIAGLDILWNAKYRRHKV